MDSRDYYYYTCKQSTKKLLKFPLPSIGGINPEVHPLQQADCIKLILETYSDTLDINIALFFASIEHRKIGCNISRSSLSLIATSSVVSQP
jgi:hypothetical protein